MQKNVNKVVVIVSPVASHQVSYTYVAIPSFVLQTVVVQTIEFSLSHVHDMLGVLKQNSGKPDKQTGIHKANSTI